jgi:hypothetical protein
VSAAAGKDDRGSVVRRAIIWSISMPSSDSGVREGYATAPKPGGFPLRWEALAGGGTTKTNSATLAKRHERGGARREVGAASRSSRERLRTGQSRGAAGDGSPRPHERATTTQRHKGFGRLCSAGGSREARAPTPATPHAGECRRRDRRLAVRSLRCGRLLGLQLEEKPRRGADDRLFLFGIPPPEVLADEATGQGKRLERAREGLSLAALDRQGWRGGILQ